MRDIFPQLAFWTLALFAIAFFIRPRIRMPRVRFNLPALLTVTIAVAAILAPFYLIAE